MVLMEEYCLEVPLPWEALQLSDQAVYQGVTTKVLLEGEVS